MEFYDVIIIGSGPAGICAAIYTSRAGLKTLVLGILENSNAYKAHIFENYMGFVEPLSGPTLMQASKKQAEKFGAKFISREAVDVHHEVSLSPAENTPAGIFVVRDTDAAVYQGKTLMLCSGLGFKPSGIKREKEMTGRGVSFCVTCDGPFFKKKKVAVIGDGNYAADEAIQLTTYTSDITVLSHGKDFTMNAVMQTELEKRHIAFRKTPKILALEGEEKVEKILFADGSDMVVEGVFVALGIAAAADFANKLGIEKNGAYLVADPKTGQTNVPGVYAAGDCTGGNVQAAKSSGEGCNAAVSVIKFLKGMAAYVDYS